jgi:hypothetical protein
MQKQFMGVAALGAALAIGDASHAQAVQWRVEDGGNGHWYEISSTASQATVADAASRLKGAFLAIVTSSAENLFLFQLAQRSPGFHSAWIGGFQDFSDSAYSEPAGAWKWLDGQPIGDFAAWDTTYSEPNNANGAQEDWIELTNLGTWNDTAQSLSRVAILEWSADCNADGIVDYGQCRDGSLPDYNGNNVPDCCETGQACAVGNYPVQWRVTDGGNGRWYKIQLTEQPLLWTAAREIAGAFGGQLLSVNTAGEQTTMEALLRTAKDSTGCHPAVFIGLSKRPGVPWRWEDGSELSYENWACGEPFDPDYPEGKVVMYNPAACEDYCVPHLRWNDVSQLVLHPLHRGVAIEWSADCNADGIVDYGQILQGHLPDTNGNGVPDACEVLTCANADLFRDSNINGADLGILLAQWGEANAQTVSDINRDGAVDGVDLGLLLSFWGPCPN